MKSTFISFVLPVHILLMRRLPSICWSHFVHCYWWLSPELHSLKQNNSSFHTHRSGAIGYCSTASSVSVWSSLQRLYAFMENIKMQICHLPKVSHIPTSKFWPFVIKHLNLCWENLFLVLFHILHKARKTFSFNLNGSQIPRQVLSHTKRVQKRVTMWWWQRMLSNYRCFSIAVYLSVLSQFI